MELGIPERQYGAVTAEQPVAVARWSGRCRDDRLHGGLSGRCGTELSGVAEGVHGAVTADQPIPLAGWSSDDGDDALTVRNAGGAEILRVAEGEDVAVGAREPITARSATQRYGAGGRPAAVNGGS